MHPESANSMKSYMNNMPKLYTMLAYEISYQLSNKKETYESSANFINQKHTEDL